MTKKIPIFWLLLFFPMLSSGYDFSNLRNTPMQWVDGTLLLPSRWYLLSDKELNDKGHVFEESHESDSALLYYGILAQRLESRLANKVADTNDIHLYIKIRNEMGLIYMSDFHDIQAFQCFLDAYEWSLVSKKEIYRMSVLTNMGTGLRQGEQSHAETLAQGEKASAALQKLIKTFLQREKYNG